MCEVESDATDLGFLEMKFTCRCLSLFDRWICQFAPIDQFGTPGDQKLGDHRIPEIQMLKYKRDYVEKQDLAENHQRSISEISVKHAVKYP